MKLYKTFIAALGLAAALIITPSQIAQAEEFTVTDVSAVLWTNDSTALCSDADTSTVAVPVVEAGLPVQVTGVTDNGFFRINIGGTTWYVAGIGLSADTSTTTTDTTATATTSSTGWTQESVYAALMNLKATKYPEGTLWDSDKYDTIKFVFTGTYGTFHSYGGGAFTWRVMKDIFGENVVITQSYTEDINDIKIGDVISYHGNLEIVTAIDDTYVYVVMGNYCLNNAPGIVHWDQEILISDLISEYIKCVDDDGTVTYELTESPGVVYYTAY